jgi:hypothetical protein
VPRITTNPAQLPEITPGFSRFARAASLTQLPKTTPSFFPIRPWREPQPQRISGSADQRISGSAGAGAGGRSHGRAEAKHTLRPTEAEGPRKIFRPGQKNRASRVCPCLPRVSSFAGAYTLNRDIGIWDRYPTALPGARATVPWVCQSQAGGQNTLQFQIASRSSTAFSTFRTPPPGPCSFAIYRVYVWALQFQSGGSCSSCRSWLGWLAPLASAGPALASGYVLGARRPCFVLGTGLHAPEVHPAPASVTTQVAPLYLNFPPPKCEPPAGGPLRSLCLRLPCGADVRSPKHPAVPQARPRRLYPSHPAVLCHLQLGLIGPHSPTHAHHCRSSARKAMTEVAERNMFFFSVFCSGRPLFAICLFFLYLASLLLGPDPSHHVLAAPASSQPWHTRCAASDF